MAMRVTRPQNITISFGITVKSKYYNEAVSLMMSPPSYLYMADEQRHTVTLDILKEWELIHKLTSICHNWMSARLELDTGEDIHHGTIAGVYTCLAKRTGENYCFGRHTSTSSDKHIWGCYLLGWELGNEGPNAWWYYGHLDGEVFYVHKEDIWAKLLYLAKDRGFLLCPFFSFEIAQEILKHLPDSIDPHKDKAWEYRQEWQLGKYKVIGVKPSSGRGRWVLENWLNPDDM